MFQVPGFTCSRLWQVGKLLTAGTLDLGQRHLARVRDVREKHLSLRQNSWHSPVFLSGVHSLVCILIMLTCANHFQARSWS